MQKAKIFLGYSFSFIVILCISESLYAVSTENQINKLIVALQQKDFKSAFELSRYFSGAIANIKASNPKILWDKKIADFFAGAKSQLYDGRPIDTVLTFSQYDMTPVSSFKIISYFFIPSCKWQIIEKRGTRYYISVEYDDIETAPRLYSVPIKKSIFVFDMTYDGFFDKCSYFPDGEERWGEEYDQLMAYEQGRLQRTLNSIQGLIDVMIRYFDARGRLPLFSGLFDESCEPYKSLSSLGEQIPTKDGWGNYFHVTLRDVVAMGAPNNLLYVDIVSYGRNGINDGKENLVRVNDTEYKFDFIDDFNKDIMRTIQEAYHFKYIKIPEVNTSEKTSPAKSEPIRIYSESDLIGAIEKADYIITGGKNYTVRWVTVPNEKDRRIVLEKIYNAKEALNSAAEIAKNLLKDEALWAISQCEEALDRDLHDFNSGGGGKRGLKDAQRIIRNYLKGLKGKQDKP